MTTKRESKRILSVTVKQEADYDGDTSRMGEYSDDPQEYAIVNRGEHEGEFVDQLPCECGHDRAQHGSDPQDTWPCADSECDCENYDPVSIERGRSYRYFNSASIESDNSDEDNRTYAMQDYDRMRRLNNGDWCFMGINAKAVVQLNGDLTQTIHSGGLWGIESDSGESYFDEVADEQLDELRDQLHAIGFSKRAVTAAFRNVECREL